MTWPNNEISNSESGIFDVSGKNSRVITYAEAIREALDISLAVDPGVFIMGQGVDDEGGIFGSTKDLQIKYGKQRVFDTPLAENGITGVAVGAALAGLRPIVVHNRMDFILLAMDQLVNHAAKWSYMFGGKMKVPLVVRTVSSRGWGSAAQHAQCLQGMMLNVPGLKIAIPSTAYDAKGLLISGIRDDNPVLFCEHRWLYSNSSPVPESAYTIPFGKGIIRKKGTDVTLVALSYMVNEAVKAAEELDANNISVEIIDIRTIKPLDEEIILNSLGKTGRLVIADTGCKTGGVCSEIAAIVCEKAFKLLKSPIVRIACPDLPVPASDILESAYYPDAKTIYTEIISLMHK